MRNLRHANHKGIIYAIKPLFRAFQLWSTSGSADEAEKRGGGMRERHTYETTPNVSLDLHDGLKKDLETHAFGLANNKSNRVIVGNDTRGERIKLVHLDIGGYMHVIGAGFLELTHGHVGKRLAIAVEVVAGTKGHAWATGRAGRTSDAA